MRKNNYFRRGTIEHEAVMGKSLYLVNTETRKPCIIPAMALNESSCDLLSLHFRDHFRAVWFSPCSKDDVTLLITSLHFPQGFLQTSLRLTHPMFSKHVRSHIDVHRTEQETEERTEGLQWAAHADRCASFKGKLPHYELHHIFIYLCRKRQGALGKEMWCRKVLLPLFRALQRQILFLNLSAAFIAFAF